MIGRMRLFYSALLYLLLPAVLLRLWLKGRRLPGYRRHWRERFALQTCAAQGAIWLHAVSVGEVRALVPLAEALQARYPDRPMLVTVTTATGRQTVRQLFGDRVMCRYLPYDLPGAVRRFLAALQPAVAIFMEVELWPNLYAGLAARAVPLYLVNARLSEKSLRRYRYIGGLMRKTVGDIRHIAAQGEGDRERFLQLGVRPGKISVTGNLKYAAQLPADFHTRARQWREQLSGNSPVWVAASTHQGEEEPLIRAHLEVLQRFPQALLLLVPRHPERSADVLRQCNAAGLSCELYSRPPLAGVSVVIVDRLGQLVYCYAAAEVAFVGGSLVDCGGHNPVEALLAGTPVISGPHLDNFVDLYTRLQAAGAALRVGTASELSARLTDWFLDPQARERAVRAGRAVLQENQGVVQRVLDVIDPLPPPVH
jgi:3-deoxy-D-manno-octulosonic-acid transferase